MILVHVLVSLLQLPEIGDFLAGILDKEVERVPCPLHGLHVPGLGSVVLSLNEVHQIP